MSLFLRAVVLAAAYMSIYPVVAAQTEETSGGVCDSININAQRKTVISNFERNGIEYQSEDLTEFYTTGFPRKSEIFDFLFVSLSNELIAGTYTDENGIEVMFQVGIGTDELVAMVFCSKILIN